MGEIDDIQAKIAELEALESWLETSGPNDVEDGWSPTFAGVISLVNMYGVWLAERSVAARKGWQPSRQTDQWLKEEIAATRRTIAEYEAGEEESPLLDAVRKAGREYIEALEAERRERGES